MSILGLLSEGVCGEHEVTRPRKSYKGSRCAGSTGRRENNE